MKKTILHMLSIFDARAILHDILPKSIQMRGETTKNIYLLGDKRGDTYGKMLSYCKTQDAFPSWHHSSAIVTAISHSGERWLFKSLGFYQFVEPPNFSIYLGGILRNQSNDN